MARTLLVWGCTSGAGKSWLATALCRVAARRGLDVVPFKAQNMSNNARVVARPGDGVGEIGSAQYFQALAARVAPGTDHNPVLLKPERDTASQVVVNGIADPMLSRLPWRLRSAQLATHAQAAFERLAARHQLIVVEGAGSPAEINLAEHDYVNLHVARWAQQAGPAAAWLVTDIDRGGSFAHLYGTWALLPADLQGLLQGFVLNRFRGDAGLLAPGPQHLQQRCGVPTLGVLPLLRGHGLPDEDAVHEGPAGSEAGRGDAVRLRVAVIALPRISNLDEFQPLALVPGVRLRWVREPAQLEGADWVVLPGSKQVSGDLAWLRLQGLDAAVQRHAYAGRPVLGVCGGLQMLGRTLHDPQGHDGQAFDALAGLGLLPLRTEFQAGKHLRAGPVIVGGASGAWQDLDGMQAAGYEIRCGSTSGPPLAAVLFDPQGQAIGWQQGPVLGVYAHGLFECPAVMQALFGADVPTLDQRIDALADAVERHIDPSALKRALGA